MTHANLVLPAVLHLPRLRPFHSADGPVVGHLRRPYLLGRRSVDAARADRPAPGVCQVYRRLSVQDCWGRPKRTRRRMASPEPNTPGKARTPARRWPRPSSRKERHITADVGWAAWQYYLWTGDKAYLAKEGWPVLSGDGAVLGVARDERRGRQVPYQRRPVAR